MEKKRIIVDYKNITNKLLSLLVETYPNGYEDHIIKFKNAKNEWVSAVPLETDEAKYLVKVGVELDKRVEAFTLLDEEDENIPVPLDVSPTDIDDEDLESEEEDERPKRKKRTSDRLLEAGFDPEDDEDEEDDYADEEDDEDEDDY